MPRPSPRPCPGCPRGIPPRPAGRRSSTSCGAWRATSTRSGLRPYRGGRPPADRARAGRRSGHLAGRSADRVRPVLRRRPRRGRAGMGHAARRRRAMAAHDPGARGGERASTGVRTGDALVAQAGDHRFVVGEERKGRSPTARITRTDFRDDESHVWVVDARAHELGRSPTATSMSRARLGPLTANALPSLPTAVTMRSSAAAPAVGVAASGGRIRELVSLAGDAEAPAFRPTGGDWPLSVPTWTTRRITSCRSVGSRCAQGNLVGSRRGSTCPSGTGRGPTSSWRRTPWGRCSSTTTHSSSSSAIEAKCPVPHHPRRTCRAAHRPNPQRRRAGLATPRSEGSR